jgi:hypothetical protein
VELLTGVFVPIAIGVLFHLARFAYWIWKIGDTIVIPWDNDATPPFAPLASRARTRDASRLAIREPDYCALIFMKRPKRCGPKRYRMDMLPPWIAPTRLIIAHGSSLPMRSARRIGESTARISPLSLRAHLPDS